MVMLIGAWVRQSQRKHAIHGGEPHRGVLETTLYGGSPREGMSPNFVNSPCSGGPSFVNINRRGLRPRVGEVVKSCGAAAGPRVRYTSKAVSNLNSNLWKNQMREESHCVSPAPHEMTQALLPSARGAPPAAFLCSISCLNLWICFWALDTEEAPSRYAMRSFAALSSSLS